MDVTLMRIKLSPEKGMNTRRKKRLVHEGQYVAEVEVEVIDTDTGWSPYLSLEDAYKLDQVRAPLARGDIKGAVRRVYSLTPVSQ